MNRPLLSLLFSVLVCGSPALACFNDYVPNVAAIERSKSVLDQLQKHVVKEPWDVRRDRLRKELANGGDYKVKNDLATTLAHTSEATEAVNLLEQVEAEKPGLYVTASNLGTAYELAGNDEKALEWIRKGIARNPNAHERTEWLHVKILEAKLALKNDPKWLDSHSIVDPGKEVGSLHLAAVGNRGEKLSDEEIKKALIYQLHERLQFVSPPDAIVGSLLVDLGELLSQEPPGIGAAKDVMDLASAYLTDAPNVAKLREVSASHVNEANLGQRHTRHEPPFGLFTYLSVAGVVLIAAIIGLKRLMDF